MGGSVIRRLVILLGIKADTGDAPKVGDALEGIRKQAARAKTVLLGMAAAVSAAIGIAVASTSENVREVTKWSEALGVPAERMQALGIAFQGVGLEMEDAADLMFNAAERLVDADLEGPASGAAVMAKRLGLSLKDANGNIRGHEEILFDVADAMQRVATDTERTAIANTFFGDVGVRALGVLKNGGQALREEVERIQATGAVMSQDDIDVIQDANEKFTRLNASLKGLVSRALQPVFSLLNRHILPSIIKVVEGISNWIRAGDRLARINRALVVGFKLLATGLTAIGIVKAVTGFLALARAIWAGVIAMRAMGNAAIFAQAKILAIPLAIAAILLLLDDVATWLRGGDSLIGRFIERFKETDGVLGMLARGLDELKPALIDLFNTGMAVVKRFVKSARSVLASFGTNLSGALQFGWSVVSGILALFYKTFLFVVKTAMRIALGFSRVFGKTIVKLYPRIKRVAGRIAALASRVLPGFIKIAGVLMSIGGAVLSRVLPIVVTVIGAVVDVIEWALGVFESVLDTVVVVIDKVARFVEALVTFVTVKLPEWLGNIVDSVVNAVSSILEWLGLSWDWIIEKATSAISAITGLLSAAGNTLTGWWDSFTDMILTVFDEILGGINEVLAPLKDLLDTLDSASDFLLGEDEGVAGRGGGGSLGRFVADAQAQGSEPVERLIRSSIEPRASSRLSRMRAAASSNRTANISQEITIMGNGDPAVVEAAARSGATGGVEVADRRAATRDLAAGG